MVATPQRFSWYSLGKKSLGFAGALLVLPIPCFADIFISELMYDLSNPATDDGREWVEVKNDSTTNYLLSELRFVDKNGRHLLKSLSNETEIAANSCAVIADNPDKFKIDNPTFSGVLLDSSFSLVNTTDTISISRIVDKVESVLDSISYSKEQGAAGDGNSLHRSGGSFNAGAPSPGVCDGVINQSGGNSPPPPTDQGGSSNQSQTATTTSAASLNPLSNHPVEPQIFAFIKGDKATITGVESIWSGSTVGLDKKPIDGARYFWSFGDGVTKEGQTVAHAWLVPGTYLVVVEVSVGDFNASNRQKVIVTTSGFSIEKVESGGNGFIVIKNSLPDDINISRWILRSAGKTFTFPSPTVILAGTSVPFPNGVTNLESDSDDTKLFYPNGTLAVKFEQKKEAVKQITDANPSKVVTAKSALIKKMPTLEPRESSTTKPADYAASSSPSFGATPSTVIYAAAVGESGGYTDWIFALLGLIGIGAAGVLFSKGIKNDRQLSKAGEGLSDGQAEPESLSADDFEIIEEKE